VKKPVEPELLAAVESALAKKGLSKDPRPSCTQRSAAPSGVTQVAGADPEAAGPSHAGCRCRCSARSSGRSQAPRSLLCKIASALRLRMAELFGGA
jgi:hypothetical protein